MKKNMILAACILAVPMLGCSKTPWKEDIGVRISWDKTTFQEVREIPVGNLGYTETNLYYPRVKRLTDGALLFTFSNHHYGWDIYASRSEDDGKTWQDAYCIAHSYDTTYVSSEGNTKPDRIVYVNPDFTELQDGRIILAFQWRFSGGYGDLPKTNENCGVMISFSEDKGRTWSAPREVFRGRCWEPAFLQLPSGEIQMYITSSQDIKDNTSYPRTIVIRSFDNGETWQGKPCCGIEDPEAISRSVDDRFAYDGMPSGVLLADGKGILVPLESWHGKLVVDQTPIVVKTTMEQNWRTDQKKLLEEGGPDSPMKKEVNKDFQGYGPYGTSLPGGEVLILSNGTYKGRQGIWTFVGDKTGDNFHFATSPFTSDEYWGSIAYVGNGEVFAASTYKYRDEKNEVRGMIRMIRGRVNEAQTIRKGKLEVPAPEAFSPAPAGWWFLGRRFPSPVYAGFGYTAGAFEIGACVLDESLASYTPENSDAPAIMFARTDGSVYEMVVTAEGKYIVYQEEGFSWHLIHQGVTEDLCVRGTLNDDSDIDTGYSVKVSIPWKVIGGVPRAGEEMKVHLRRFHKKNGKEKPLSIQEDLQGENSDYPQEWLSLILK